MGCKLCKSTETLTDTSDNKATPASNHANDPSLPHTHDRHNTDVSLRGSSELHHKSWRMRGQSIGPFVVNTNDGGIDDHVTVLDGDDLLVTPKSSPLLLERCPVLFHESEEKGQRQNEDDEEVEGEDSGPESVASGGSRTTLGSIGSLVSTDSSSNDTSTPVEMSDEWSSAKSGPGALCLKNSSSRRAAFQVRYIDGQTNQANQTQRSSLMKDVLATPDGGILEAGASMDVEVLLAAHGLRQGEEAELTVRDDRLLITALWFDDNVDLEALSVTELEAALSKLWKEKLGSSKRYRVRIALSEMVLVPLEEETRGANSVGGVGGVGGGLNADEVRDV